MPTIPKREFGDTGERLSIIGLGGITITDTSQSRTEEILEEAMEQGVNYVDVSPTYGNAEDLLGPVIRKHRDEIFLACKTNRRLKNEASSELDQSLKKLKTSYFDLYQLHGIRDIKEVETIFSPNGAIHAFIEAQRDGLIRYIGFSAHSVNAALRSLDLFDFDSMLFPVNFVLYFKEDFGSQVVEKACEKGVVRLALKAMARGKWPSGSNRKEYPKSWYQPFTNPKLVDMALRFTLSQPITAAIPPGDERLFKMALQIASNFEPINNRELEELKSLAIHQEPIFRLDG